MPLFIMILIAISSPIWMVGLALTFSQPILPELGRGILLSLGTIIFLAVLSVKKDD